MDEIVKQAIAKWPDVPHCYGWLGLDARGAWRMRDQHAQDLGLAGDKIVHAALLGFIARNYSADARGCWFFQNGPQRVYVNLEATPFIARTDPDQGFVLHTGAPFGTPDQVFMTEHGELILQTGERVAQLDDRDMAQAMTDLELDGKPVADEALLAWVEGAPGALTLTLTLRGQRIAVQRIARAAVAGHFGFVRAPAPEAAAAVTSVTIGPR
jgi:hypothetical protein